MEVDEVDFEGRTVPEIRELADEYAHSHSWADIETLPTTDEDTTGFKVEAWARKAVAERELPERLAYLQTEAQSEDWRVRERVAQALKYVNRHAFEQVEDAWEGWVTHDDNCVRRACEVGLMGVPDEHVAGALDLLDHLVSDSDTYVQKSCGAFAVSAIANSDPAVGREYLDRWSRADDLRTRWNVAKAIGSAYGFHNEHALDLASRLADDDAYRVRRATASSVKKLVEKDVVDRERVEGWVAQTDFQSML